jgi:hypothetical protein
MFQPTWPSSGVYDISLFIPEGICFAAFVAFVSENTTPLSTVGLGQQHQQKQRTSKRKLWQLTLLVILLISMLLTPLEMNK